jgi:hypothetical protein
MLGYCVDPANATLCPSPTPLGVKKCSTVKNSKTILLGTLVAAVVLSALILPATASYTHPRGILITTWPQDIVVFFNSPASHDQTLAVVIKPPWYFVDNLMGFTSVTLTMTLTGSCYQCRPNHSNPPTLAGADSSGKLVVQFGAVTMQEGDNGAVILCPITFVISGPTGRGFYMLFLSAEAHAADGTTFLGWDQIPVAVLA